LNAQDARLAIALPAERAGVRIHEDALHLLADASAGYPYFIQRYAASAWNRREGTDITRADAERIIPLVRHSIETNLYVEPFNALAPTQYRYVLALAELGPGAHPVREIAAAMGATSEETSSTRRHLLRKNIVFSPTGGMLEFAIPFAEEYVRDHREIFEQRAAPFSLTQWMRKAVVRGEDLVLQQMGRPPTFTSVEKFQGRVLETIGPFTVVGNESGYFQLYENAKLYKPVEIGQTAFFLRLESGQIVVRSTKERDRGHLRMIGGEREAQGMELG
jgi:hypothetical protein